MDILGLEDASRSNVAGGEVNGKPTTAKPDPPQHAKTLLTVVIPDTPQHPPPSASTAQLAASANAAITAANAAAAVVAGGKENEKRKGARGGRRRKAAKSDRPVETEVVREDDVQENVPKKPRSKKLPPAPRELSTRARNPSAKVVESTSAATTSTDGNAKKRKRGSQAVAGGRVPKMVKR
ncbi:hypothetical protein FIBSPDRAFT_970360 [Athelia psychrophila]|uniref:Uncharacterized protein n=1 Tax=Athelia psychrophila TaxID=1759441 RepID=A0A167SR66_9AGAM|nr:hypothetical protein FIBSPDRAFT_970360 [Fibularhizoctonia sp. CBS 109695]